MKTRLFILLSSLIVLVGVGAIAWFLFAPPLGNQVATMAPAAAVSEPEKLVRTPAIITGAAGIPADNPQTTGDEVVGIDTAMPTRAKEGTRAAEIRTGQARPMPTEPPGTASQTTGSLKEEAASAMSQSPDTQLTVGAQLAETQLTESQPTAVPAVEVQAAGLQPPDSEAAESVPVVNRQGQFRDGDEVHKGSGTATISQKADGSYLLSFENFAVCCGPDLYVFLASNSSPTSHSNLGDYLELSPLKASTGDQTYEISADTNLSEINSIVIYCKPFEVIISTATLGQGS